LLFVGCTLRWGYIRGQNFRRLFSIIEEHKKIESFFFHLRFFWQQDAVIKVDLSSKVHTYSLSLVLQAFWSIFAESFFLNTLLLLYS
jgi:hypothetical protein